MRVTVKDRQTLADIALRYSGTFDSALEIAVLNGIAISDGLHDGQELEIPDSPEDTAVVRRYKVKGVEPATGLDDDDLSSLAQEGIDFMGIEIDFNIS